jgi:hypothetical protein
MVYLLLVIGLVLIYFSLKSEKPSGKGINFSTVLQNKIDSKDIESIIEQMKYFSDRIENIEASLLLIEEKLPYDNVNNPANKVQFPELNSNDLEIIQDNAEPKLMETNPQAIENKTLNDTLYQLYDEGSSIDEISSITRIGKGEILLRLGFRKQRS